MNNYPKLHNAGWPGIVGKGPDAEESFLDLDTMLDLTAGAQLEGARFDGIDLFLSAPHVDIDSSDDELKALVDKVQARSLVIGSLVAPVWPPTGGGSAMGDTSECNRFLEMVTKACAIGRRLKQLGVRPSGVIRIDSSVDPGTWACSPGENTQKIAETFLQACDIAEDYGEKLAAEGEICWGGMHSWKEMITLLELVDRPETLGFQADLAHTLLYLLGYNAPDAAILPSDFEWDDPRQFDDAYRTLTDALRPWTVDFHVAQNDATVKGSGSHDKTGRHCLPDDPNGKLDIVRASGSWLRDGSGRLTKKCRHICWDGCMFPNDVMGDPQTWNQILGAMIQVRTAHGWQE